MMNEKPIAIIGAGLVGSLLAIYLSQRGYKVEIFERREDLRQGNLSGGKSINLALSDRGWKALKGVGIADEVMKIAIAMKGRMTHDLEGKTNFLPYGKEGQAIYSVSRAGLNMLLMNLAEQKGTKIHFNQRCKNISLKNRTIVLEDERNESMHSRVSTFYASRIFGTDGAFSAARLQLQLSTDRFEYSQHYLNYGYKELHIPPISHTPYPFPLTPNALHIWPRGNFMMIALPNIDGSFTCTLFFPFEGEESFSTLKTEESVRKFFDKTFPDAVPLMPTLIEDFFHNPSASLVTVRCYPWSYEDKLLLLGDAAHAVVPFYGQGMNCGFEDCTVLNEMMEKFGQDWKKIFEETPKLRKPNADAIAELAVSNFVEMRDLVNRADFILQKKIEARFSAKHPDLWLPLYSMVTFSDLPYSHALEQGKKQDAIMKKVLALSNISESWDSAEVDEMMLALVKENQAYY